MKPKFLFNILIPFTLLFFLFQISPLYAQEESKKEEKGKLAEFEKAVQKGNDENKQSKKDQNEIKNENTSNDDDEFSFYLLKEFTLRIVLGIGTDPIENELHLRNTYFSDYPYINEDDGLFTNRIGKNYSFHFTEHYFYSNSKLKGFGLRGQFDPIHFLNIGFHYTYLTENLKTLIDNLKLTDNLHLYDVFFNYYRFRHERWLLKFGVGVKGLQRVSNYNGPALNFGFQMYPLKPISFYSNYNLGYLNNQLVSELLLYINLHINRFILNVGYQRFSAGKIDINGIIVGTGIYF
jgi:hypothetical protein